MSINTEKKNPEMLEEEQIIENQDTGDTTSEKEQEKKVEVEEELEGEEALLAEIAELKAVIKERHDKYLRLYAEFENFRNRTTREKVDIRKLASQDTIMKLLPVMDDFNRAKAVAEDKVTGEVFTEGVRLVYEKFKKALKDCGVEAMKTNGEKFDSELHEAFAELPVDDKKKKGMIIDTIETGYYLNDKIIRHAKVVVGK